MTLNEILTKHNFITKIVFKNGDKELSKELKVKIMRMRMAYNKIRKQFEDESNEFSSQLISDDLRKLALNNNRTDEENKKFKELNEKLNQEYQEFLVQKGKEEVNIPLTDTISEEDYFDILDLNSDNEVEINGTKLSALDFLEIFYSLFVE